MPSQEILNLIEEAEQRHTMMYDARPHNLKDLRDDAYMYFSQARKLAEAAGDTEAIKDIEDRENKVGKTYAQLRT